MPTTKVKPKRRRRARVVPAWQAELEKLESERRKWERQHPKNPGLNPSRVPKTHRESVAHLRKYASSLMQGLAAVPLQLELAWSSAYLLQREATNLANALGDEMSRRRASGTSSPCRHGGAAGACESCTLDARSQALIEAERDAGEPFFQGVPERWYENPKFRCINGHVLSSFRKTTDGAVCLDCGAYAQATSPEDEARQ